MNYFNPINWFKKTEKSPVQKYATADHSGLQVREFAAQSFNGEKNLGALGDPINYALNYDVLRVRSWQSYLESEISQTVIKKFLKWIIGGGLKIQSNPNKQVLKSEGIEINTEAFNEVMETRFAVWANSPFSSYSSQKNLHRLAKTAKMNAIIGGDVLVVLRVIKGIIKVQLIDGCHLMTDGFGTDYFPKPVENGNVVKHGIEMDNTGKHVAYYIRKADYTFERIEAYVNGVKMVYLVYGSEYKIDNSRGLPLLAVMLETLKKLERYKEATVGSAEERQKLVYYIKHGANSTGENPLISQMAMAVNPNGPSKQLPETQDGEKLASKVAATTEKMTFNMPQDSELRVLESKNELYFEPFYKVNSKLLCSSINIPPDVAFSDYNSNFSASRAALKDWEHTLLVERDEFAFEFYKPIYDLHVYLSVMTNKINAPGYLEALQSENIFVLESYHAFRAIGPSIPHIDPLKEVKAIREKLGEAGKHLPLTTLENAVEELGNGDSDSNMRQFSEELKMADELEIELEKPETTLIPPVKKENTDKTEDPED